MYFKYYNEELHEEISCFIKNFTNKNTLKINEIDYSTENSTISFTIIRNDESIKKLIRVYIRDIESIIIKKEDWIKEEIIILFGVILKSKNLYISSVEENKGVIGFEMNVNVTKWNIEIEEEEIG